MAKMRLWLWAALIAILPQIALANSSLVGLIEEALLPRFAANMPDGARLEVHLPPEAPAKVRRLLALEYDKSNQSFLVTTEDLKGFNEQFRGQIKAVIDLLVPLRPISPGEITHESDFEWRSLPAQSMSRFVLSDPSKIIGREARRLLPEGRPVQAQSLQEPRLIKRGQKVELLYSRGALEVTAPARALEDGFEGDVIRVQNLNSNRTVMATPLGEGQVAVVQ